MSPTSRTVLLGKPDAYLVERARQGCDVAFAEIVARYRPSLLRHCSRYLSRPRAEDAVQQTFIRAMQWLRSGADVRELRPWLYAIARNVALNELAKNGWDHDELPEGWEDHAGSDDVERRATWRETLGAVAALPDRQRRALLRSVVDGDSPATIAVELGVSEGAVRQLVHRARVSVRAAVGGVLPAPLAWLARKICSGAARIAPTSPAAATPLAPKLAVVVVAAISTGVPLAAIVHQATARPPALVRVAFHTTASPTSHTELPSSRRAARGGTWSGAGPARNAPRAGPSFTTSSPAPARKPRRKPPAAQAPGAIVAAAASADQTASDPGTSSCDPNDPSCVGSSGTTAACDPNTDPNCGGSTGPNTACDPNTDPSCGGTTGGSTGGTAGGNTGCDPSTDPSCGGSTGGTTGCDPATDPSCGGSTSSSSVSAGSSSDASAGGSPSPAATQSAPSSGAPPADSTQTAPSDGSSPVAPTQTAPSGG